MSRSWLVEDGIGETRAALIEDDHILAALIEPDGPGPRAGAILPARLLRGIDATGRGRVRLDDGSEAMIRPVPREVPEGATLNVEVVREPIPERGNPKPPVVRASIEALRPAPPLVDRLSGAPVVRLAAHAPDALEASGWSELLEEARDGEIGFPGGRLRMAVTPAMTLFDVDGALPPAALALAGTAAALAAILRHDIGGSIGLDLPGPLDRETRAAAAALVDMRLPQPFERTAVNGFGFLQIVRRRTRPSLPERLAADPGGAAARALLRRAERGAGRGTRTLVAAPQLIARLEERGDWLQELARRLGVPVALQADPGRAIWSFDAVPQHP